MRKRLTAAAHCAIKMRSEEPNKSRAVQLLWEDLQNGPLHCFGIHDNCSTDYCTATRKTSSSPDTSLVGSRSPSLSSVTVSSPGPSSLTDSGSPDLSSIAGSPCMYGQSSDCSSTDASFRSLGACSSSISRDTSSDSSTTLSQSFLGNKNGHSDSGEVLDNAYLVDELCDIASDQSTAWRDALNDENLENVRSVPTQPPQSIDPEMYCDIQVLVGRLIAKTPQLLGKWSDV